MPHERKSEKAAEHLPLEGESIVGKFGVLKQLRQTEVAARPALSGQFRLVDGPVSARGGAYAAKAD
jgi:hypothetical protein